MENGYTNIPDWMLSLDLDVYETIILAVIYGFSQDGESTFQGSQNYLARKARCSKRKVATALGVLMEKDYIKKIDKEIRGLHLCEYYCTMCKGIAPGAMGCECGATNNIDNNIDIKSICNKGQRFSIPTLEEVREYCRERGNKVDPQAFIDHYTSNGWMVGKSKMKDWKASVRTWERRETTSKFSAPRRESAFEHNLRVADELNGTNLHDAIYGGGSR